jgi:hypothetical protein
MMNTSFFMMGIYLHCTESSAPTAMALRSVGRKSVSKR